MLVEDRQQKRIAEETVSFGNHTDVIWEEVVAGRNGRSGIDKCLIHVVVLLLSSHDLKQNAKPSFSVFHGEK